MHGTRDIEATIRKAKRQRADHIGTKLHGSVLPLALVALLSFALVQFAVGSEDEPAQSHAVTDVTAQNG
jgi:hypothetical protein